jgi:hypothetical protein
VLGHISAFLIFELAKPNISRYVDMSRGTDAPKGSNAMESLSEMIARLKKRAYDQGYLRGQRSQSLNLADWEPEFHEDFKRGYRDGKAGN